MAAPYKLRCNLLGHKKDVRSIAPALFPEGGVVSGSRDCSTCVWMPNDHDASFTQGQVLTGHSNFVASVVVMAPDENHPQGLIVTGSNDSTILLFEPGKLEAVAKLTGHTNTVCALATGKFGFLLSGSWDQTAKVWLNQKCVMTLKGHESAVWAVGVISEKGLMLTGSADKTIKMWKAGKEEQTFRGHEDCVRSLVVVDENSFLSCSNDATIRRWALSGDCLGTYYGHTNYVYSISLLPNGQDFVTGGEDRTVRVWQGGECVQTIPHPTQSVWCVSALGNGDIVTGSSDGILRVFTREASRMASQEDQKTLEDMVASTEIPTQLGDISTDDLPGPEALINPGTKEGQQKMVKQGDKVELYSWEQAQAKWTKVGDVVGSSGGKQETSGKTLFEGKEYDYVFSVDIEEGKPPLKLPYNRTEDPWQAAQGFLHRYELSQLFLDQVANFIVTNAKGGGAALGSQPAGNYADPFTGGNRYMPGGAGGAAGDTGKGGGADPFTGANSYQPSSGSSSNVASGTAFGVDPFTGAGSYKPAGTPTAPTAKGNSYFPVTTYLVMDAGNPKQIMGKLQEFNTTVEDGLRLDEAGLKTLDLMLTGQSGPAGIAVLERLLDWPADKLFPALDVLRLAVKQGPVSEHFCRREEFLPFLYRQLAQGAPPPNVLLSLRTMVNLFSQPGGAKLMGDNQLQLLQAVVGCDGVGGKNAQIAQSSAVLNLSIAARGLHDFERKSECLSAAAQLLEKERDGEAVYRLLVAVGTLCQDDEMSQAVLQSLNFEPRLRKLRDGSDLNKVIECADLLLKS